MQAFQPSLFSPLASCTQISNSWKQTKMRPQIVLFGDSITQQSFSSGGWGAALADTFSRKVHPLSWICKCHLILFSWFLGWYIDIHMICLIRLMFWFVGMVGTTQDGLFSCCIPFSLWYMSQFLIFKILFLVGYDCLTEIELCLCWWVFVNPRKWMLSGSEIFVGV